jgi:hypothetical protein
VHIGKQLTDRLKPLCLLGWIGLDATFSQGARVPTLTIQDSHTQYSVCLFAFAGHIDAPLHHSTRCIRSRVCWEPVELGLTSAHQIIASATKFASCLVPLEFLA